MVLQAHAEVLPKSNEASPLQATRDVPSRNLPKRVIDLLFPSHFRAWSRQSRTQDKKLEVYSPDRASLS
jgi:hypothetical protein